MSSGFKPRQDISIAKTQKREPIDDLADALVWLRRGAKRAQKNNGTPNISGSGVTLGVTQDPNGRKRRKD
jgi:hypothetical protein